MYKIIIVVCLLLVSSAASTQPQKPGKMTFFAEPEFMLGKVVRNYKSHPETNLRQTYALSLGAFNNDTARSAASYYNFPHAGVSLFYSDLGNSAQLGRSVSVIPYIQINASPALKNSWSFKFGLGASWFTKYYDFETNPRNKTIGSSLNWTFQAFLYRTLWVDRRLNVKVGGGYLHSSNAHTQLPNYGLNAAMLSLSCGYYFSEVDPLMTVQRANKRIEKTKSLFVQARSGLGFHELGGTESPIGGAKHNVETYAASVGFLFKRHLKVYAGFLYRYYHSFYDYLKTMENPPEGSLKWQSANISYFMGVEFLAGHIGMNVEGGLNLYKPFYRRFYDLYETGNRFNYFRMRYFTTRLGMNLYLINTRANPRNNLSLGSHINANFGKADFMDFSLTYTRRLGE